MTKTDFTDCFLARLEKGFSEKNSTEIQNLNLESLLVNVLRDAILFNSKDTAFKSKEYDYLRMRKKNEREQIAFRAAYLFESLYFIDKRNLHYFKDDFVKILSKITNESSKRHFGKILTDVLINNLLSFTNEEYEKLAETVVTWAVAPQTRVAVQIWAFEILVQLREKAHIAEETIFYLFEMFAQDSSPAMKCRLKRWKKKYIFLY